jgi:hypothetical protein
MLFISICYALLYILLYFTRLLKAGFPLLLKKKNIGYIEGEVIMQDNAGLDLFISVLLRHPEFNAVKYNAAKGEIKIEVALQGEIEVDKQELFIAEAQKCVALFNKLSSLETGNIRITFKEYKKSDLTFLSYQRDVESLSEEEVELFAGLLQKSFHALIIKDSGKIIAEDGFKEQIKENLLYKINRAKTSTSKFLAYRDHGRVLVFNK